MAVSTRYWQPDRFTARVLNPAVRWLGIATTLEVVCRGSGARQRVPVNVLDLDGVRYLVSTRGQSEWVRNLRAAGNCRLRRLGRATGYTAAELPTEQRPPVIAAYRRRWDGQVRRFFARLPEPADHPVFRLEPIT